MENNADIMLEFTECLRCNPDHAYDFITQNYYKFSKDELKDITKELLYGLYSAAERKDILQSDHDRILSDVADELDEQYEEYYAED